MKKKAIIIAAVVLAVCISAASYLTYSYFNPEIRVLVGKPVEKTDRYIETVLYNHKGKFGMPIPEKTRNHYEKFVNEVKDLTVETLTDLRDNYVAPINVKANYEEKDGRTIFSYIGTATTKDGKEVEYKKELVFDYIISRDTELVRTTESEGMAAPS